MRGDSARALAGQRRGTRVRAFVLAAIAGLALTGPASLAGFASQALVAEARFGEGRGLELDAALDRRGANDPTLSARDLCAGRAP